MECKPNYYAILPANVRYLSLIHILQDGTRKGKAAMVHDPAKNIENGRQCCTDHMRHDERCGQTDAHCCRSISG